MRIIQTIFLLLAASLTPIIPSVFSAPPAERGTHIERGSTADEWQWLFSALAAKNNTYSAFTENRYFTTRKEPIVLQGEMRLIPARGLSLHYTAPEETLTIIDTDGLLLRDAKGRTRQIKAGTRDAGLVTALLPIMRFDEESIFKQFTVYAARDGGDWRFDFVPLNEKLADALGAIVVIGAGTEIKKLTFNTSPKLRVEVLVGEGKANVTFTDDELKKYFR